MKSIVNIKDFQSRLVLNKQYEGILALLLCFTKHDHLSYGTCSWLLAPLVAWSQKWSLECTGLIAQEFAVDLVAQKMIPTDFGDPIAFPLVLPVSQIVHLNTKDI